MIANFGARFAVQAPRPEIRNPRVERGVARPEGPESIHEIGGLTTIEEKAFGNIQKIGKRCQIVGCLEPAEAAGHREFVLTKLYRSA